MRVKMENFLISRLQTSEKKVILPNQFNCLKFIGNSAILWADETPGVMIPVGSLPWSGLRLPTILWAISPQGDLQGVVHG